MDMSSASVLVSRIRLSSALWCASVLRIDITDQPKAAICARTRGKSVEVSHIVTFSFVPPPVPVRPFTTTRTRHFTSRSIYYHTRVAKSINQSKKPYQTHQKHARSVLPLGLPRRGIDREDDPVDDEHDERPAEHEPHVGVTADKGGLFEFLFRRHRRAPSVCLSVRPSLARRSEVVSTDDGWRMRRKSKCFLKIDLTVHYS